jgi:hypothetical protein
MYILTARIYSYDSPTKVLCLSPLELDFSIHLYKSKLHLLRPSTDLDLAKEEIKLAMAAGAKVHPLTAPMCVFMKAHQEYPIVFYLRLFVFKNWY